MPEPYVSFGLTGHVFKLCKENFVFQPDSLKLTKDDSTSHDALVEKICNVAFSLLHCVTSDYAIWIAIFVRPLLAKCTATCDTQHEIRNQSVTLKCCLSFL